MFNDARHTHTHTITAIHAITSDEIIIKMQTQIMSNSTSLYNVISGAKKLSDQQIMTQQTKTNKQTNRYMRVNKI